MKSIILRQNETIEAAFVLSFFVFKTDDLFHHDQVERDHHPTWGF